MLIYNKIAQLQAFLNPYKAQGQTVGFVPTMGALHTGHLSLIAISRQHCKLTICSIFVNPTQFNDKGDLERYPRTPETDIAMLESAGCDVLFMPSVEEMYPDPEEKASFAFGSLDKVLEGEHRPGHFNGVAQVVKRFFEIVGPDKAFFGKKDYQQVMIVKALGAQMGGNIEVVPCAILREPDGLAMSSRNVLLGPGERKTASHIPQMMQEAWKVVNTEGIAAAQSLVQQRVAQLPNARLDYYAVCDPETLQPLADPAGNVPKISLIALFVGKVRLIDNLD